MNSALSPFHYAFPVHDLHEARRFYGTVLGCSEGRSDNEWVDFNLFGHQIVAHFSPQARAMAGNQHHNPVDGHQVPIPHFGVVLPWTEWEQLAERLRNKGIQFVIEPTIRFRGQPGEQATMFFQDPSGNSLEFKAFKDVNSLFQREFAVIPEDSELKSLQRQLMFRPADPLRATTLTGDQIDAYNRDGFIRPITIFSDAEIHSIRQYFDQLLEKTIAAGGNSYSISTAHMKHAEVYDILTDSRIVNCVADLLGDDVVAWGSHFFCKLPGDGRAVAWHQDASYWPLSPSWAVTVWLAIDDADAENACMKFIAGSHHSGHLTYRRSSPEEHNVLDQTVDNAESYGPVVLDELKAGQVSIHNDLLLHGSDANLSDRRRCGLTLRFCNAAVRAEMGWNEKGILVRGTDTVGHWKSPSRPPET